MWQKIVDWTANFVLVGSFGLLLLVLVAPFQFDLSFHKVVGTSMEPSIRLGEVVALKKVDPQTIEAGTVIGFQPPGVDTPVVHRVVKVVLDEQGRRVGFITKGDNVEDEDPWIVSPNDVLGKVVFHVPFVGFMEEFLRTPAGFVLFVLLPGILLVVLQIRDMTAPPRRSSRWRRVSPSRRNRWAAVYLAVGLAVVVPFGIQNSSRVQERTLASFTSQPERSETPLSVTRNFRNDGPVPLLVALVPQHPDVSVNPAYVWLSPGEVERVHLEGPAEGTVAVVGFLPVLPSQMLYGLARWNARLAPTVLTFLVAVPFLFIGSRLVRDEAMSARRDRRLRLKRRYG